MTKLILDGTDAVKIAYPNPQRLRTLTLGGYGRLPGDAVTSDLDGKRRVVMAQSMTASRAVDNMVRAGHDATFSQRWIKALLAGGENDNTALDLVRQKTFPGRDGQSAIEPDQLPPDRFFRDAWKREGDAITIDMVAARTVFADRVIAAKAEQADVLIKSVETSQVSGDPADELEARYESLVAMDLRALGARVMAAQSTDELKALWPAELPL